MFVDPIQESLDSGQYARLIPTLPDSKKEEKATSSLLATFMSVPDYAQAVLSEVGANVAKRAKIICLTEVVFKSKDKRKPRPDGLIIVRLGSKSWTAIIESKIGNMDLKKEQVEEYLDLAREYGINAVITISNQFAPLATHHPLPIARAKTRAVSLFHFSWLSLVSKAILLASSDAIEDTEQSFILRELVRYLQHENSGVAGLTKMSGGWKDLCADIQQGTPVRKNAEYIDGAVSSWQQLLKYMAIRLSDSIGKTVAISLARSRVNNSELNFQTDIDDLIKHNCLTAAFDIPDTASKLYFSADFLRRTVNVSMKLDAPRDKSRATAAINWFTRQLKDIDGPDLAIRAYWPKRIPMTSTMLSAALDDPLALIPEDVKELPTHIEILMIVDLAARFKGARTFVEDASASFLKFYEHVGQHLTKWVAKPPKIKVERKTEEFMAEPEGDSVPGQENTENSMPVLVKDAGNSNVIRLNWDEREVEKGTDSL